MTELKAFANIKLYVAKLTILLFDRLEKTLRKRRKYLSPAYSSFPTGFSKAYFLGSCLKSGLCGIELDLSLLNK